MFLIFIHLIPSININFDVHSPHYEEKDERHTKIKIGYSLTSAMITSEYFSNPLFSIHM